MLNKIYIIYRKLEGKEPPTDLKRVFKSVLTGNDIKGDIKYIRRDFSWLNDNRLIAFVNKVQELYPKSTSFNTMITPFVNVLARIDAYNSSYQQLTVIAKNAIKDYNEDRDLNTTDSNDKGKVFPFEPTKVKKIIEDKLDNDREKALAAVYALQPPRRLDFQYMIVTDDGVGVLNDRNYNYLVIQGGEPSKFVYNNYKTFKTYGKQVFDVWEDVVPYLKA